MPTTWSFSNPAEIVLLWFTVSVRLLSAAWYSACRQAAWRRRRAAPRPAQPAKIDTVYECPQCQTRYLGVQRCEDCNTWCRRLGAGGPYLRRPTGVKPAPHCSHTLPAIVSVS